MKAVVEHLSELVRIGSPSGVSNRGVVEYAAGVLRGLGWTVRELPYRDAAGVEKVNAIAAPAGEDAHRRDVELAFVCHTDTVPYAADWKEALEPQIADGMLHGCGSCDVKAFLACLLTAAEGAGPGVRGGLRIVMTAEEEIGCIGAWHLREQDALRARRMVVGEPTSLHPARAGKGYCLAEVTVYGKEAHSALPGEGVSAIVHAARLIGEIEELAAEVARERNPFFDPEFTTINVGTIEGGTAKNIVPGICRFQVEWRPIPGQAATGVLESVTAIATKMEEETPGLRIEVRAARQQGGFETGASAGLVRRVEGMTGRRAVSIPFGSEASVFAAVAEEVIVFGPGDMRTAHSSRECVRIAELEEAVECLRALMRVE